MRTWFLEHYEDPVHSSPWVDGEYVFINGGPYDAEETLHGEFHRLVSEEAIKELAEELNEDCTDWTETYNFESNDYEDESEVSSAIASKEAFRAFKRSIKEIRMLLDDPRVEEQHYLRLLYVSGITSLETYLSDFFISIVKSDYEYLQAFVLKFKPFAEERFALSQIFVEMSKIEKTALDALRELLWHDLKKVSSIYKAILDIDFPEIKELYKAVAARHDFVHRSGKTKVGETRILEAFLVENVLNQATVLVEEIEKQWKKKLDSRYPDNRDLMNEDFQL